jgi:dephospho-CoA kinase
MLQVALTGNLLSGKTHVSNKFRQIGVPVFDADVVLKFILSHKFYFNQNIKKSLGYSPFSKDGYIDPVKVVSDSDFDKIIDEVEFDLLSAYERFRRAQDSPYVIFMSSLLFERGWNSKFDISINVFTKRGDRSMRAKGAGMSIIDFFSITKNEMSEFEKNGLSDHVVHSYIGGPILEESILKIDHDIKERINKLNSYAYGGRG